MIDYLTFIDELKAIKNANDTIESKKRVSGIIDQTVKKYEDMINEFEQENQQKLTLDNQVNS